MADQKISQLTAATPPLAGTEVFPIVQSGTTVKATVADVQAAPIAAQTADRMLFLNASKVPSTSANATFDGTNLGLGASPTFFGGRLAVGGHIAVSAGNSLKLWNTGGTGLATLTSTGTNGLTIAASGNTTLSDGNLVISDATKGLQLARGGEIASGAVIGPSATRTVTIAMGGTGSYSATIQVGMNVYGGGGHARAMWMVGGDVQNNNAGATAVVGPTNTGNCVISAITLAAGSVSFTVQNTNGAQNGRVSVSVTYSQSDGNTATVTIA